MIFRHFAVLAVSMVMVGLPVAAAAQSNLPTSQVVITMVLAPNTVQPASAPIVTVKATAPSLAGTPLGNGTTYSFASGFNNETRTIAFVTGGYWVTASTDTSGYYFYYSDDCSGTPKTGEVVGCRITLSTTPPPSQTSCVTNPYGPGCTPPSVVYQGPTTPTMLVCSPSYQTIKAGQSASFTATGGNSTGYNWTTTDRTTLNIGNSYTTVFQTTGVQTVMVQNGTQTANCTVNVVAGIGPITYVGSPSITSALIPSGLPNTGFGPQDTAVFAFALVLLMGAGIYVAPYVKRAIGITLG